MQNAKIVFTDEEIQLLNDCIYIERKRMLLEKISELFQQLNEDIEELKLMYKAQLPAEAFVSKGKITKGENLKGMPFMVLDNVRVFNRDDIFAFRTLFWWGHFFSYTIHLSGKYFELLKPVLPSVLNQLKSDGKFAGINTYQFHHHFEPDNYMPLSEFKSNESLTNALMKNGFIKIAGKSDAGNPHDAIKDALNFYKEFLEVLRKNTTSQ